MPQAEVLTCFEHQILTEQDFCHRVDFDYLLQQDLPCYEIQMKRGKIIIKLRQYLASIWLPSGTMLEILPKLDANDSWQGSACPPHLWVKRMMQDLLQSSFHSIQHKSIATQVSDHFDAFNFSSDTSSDWLESLLEKWCHSTASEAIRQGLKVLPRHYKTHLQNQPSVAGKLNLSAQLRHNAHRPHYVFSERQKLDEVDELKILLEVASRQVPGQQSNIIAICPALTLQQSQSLAKRWHQRLSHTVGHRIGNSQLSLWQFDVLRQAVAWARWLLSPESLNPPNLLYRESTAHLPYPATIVNMNRAFETWVTQKIKAWVCAHLTETKLLVQPSFDWLLEADQVIQRLRPDVVIPDKNNGFSHVIDIKYKFIQNLRDITSSDWQQLLVYTQQLNAQNAWLILPRTQGFYRKHVVSAGTYKLCVIPFDVSRALLVL